VTIGKITRPGLTGIALSVAALWGCLIGEHVIVRRANAEQTQALAQIARLRRQRESLPTSLPVSPVRRYQRPAAG